MTSVIKVDNIQNSSGTDAISIDSSGSMTTNQYVQQKGLPYFRAGRDAGDVSNNTDIVFNKVFEDNNGDYDNTTGKFTAPVDGTYFFGFTMLTENTAGAQDQVTIYKDSTSNDLLNLRSQGDDNAHNTLTGTLVITLTAGQTIYARVTAGTMYGTNDKWTQFCGYQIA